VDGAPALNKPAQCGRSAINALNSLRKLTPFLRAQPLGRLLDLRRERSRR
jgi:hypothetical protein